MRNTNAEHTLPRQALRRRHLALALPAVVTRRSSFVEALDPDSVACERDVNYIY